ncbi:hypothetical protein INP51_13085 [Blautia liquoris]|uniref:Uncharacterized protein n=1 Tax=Blautia liquoris TaxID=2779518 RepID=A0A7M2RHU6_9FIRM|nr:hypothetical protein [Blautia liquoris]QOV18910.1 hypothetical protein INP51_13085 [Blautia liquoris]
MKTEKKKSVQVQCPVCGYRMPIFYTEETECRKLKVPCKGRHCKNIIEVTIKDGQQIK